MPSTVWSGPVPNLGSNSASPAVAAAITDLSPSQVIIWPGMLSVGTRIRLRAYGNLITSATTATPTWGFYMNSTATGSLATTPAVLAVTGATAVVNTSAVAFPWMLEWEGQVRALTSPVVGATNAQVMGQGKAFLPLTITTFTMTAIPITAALRTVQQTATGLVTNIPQTVSVAWTPNVTTGLTSVTCDEFTCELLG